MAVSVGELEAILKLRDEMSPALKNADKNVSAFGAGLNKLVGMVGGVVSVGAAISAINKAMMAQAEAEDAINRLNTALANQGMYSEKTSKALIEHATALQNVTTFGDETIIRSEALLTSFRMNEEQIKRTTIAAADLATGMGIDLESAVGLLGRAFAGNTQMLSRYGIIVDENIPKAEKFEAVMRQLEQRFGGQAQAATQNYAGSLKQLQNAIGDTWEAAGKLFGFLSSSGDKPFQGLISGAKMLQTLFGVQIPLAFTELKANIATSLAGMAGMLEKLFDMLGKLPGSIGQQYRRGAEEMGLLRAQLEQSAEKFREQGNAAAASLGNIQSVTNASVVAANATERLSAEEKKAAEAAKKHATELKILSYALDGQAFSLEQATIALNQHLSTWSEFKPIDLAGDIEALNKFLGQGLEMDPEVLLRPIREAEAELKIMAPTWGNALKDGMAKGLGGLSNVILGALQGGGDVLRSIGAKLGGELGDSLGKVLAAKIGGSIGNALGKYGGVIGSAVGSLAGEAAEKIGGAWGGALGGAAKGASVGAMFGPIGAGIGAVVGGVAGFVVGSQAIIKHVNDMRDAFFDSYGGFEAFSKQMATVSDEDWAKKIFDAKTVEEFNALVNEAQGLLGAQAAAQQGLNDAIEKYGFTVEELGPKWQAQELDKKAAELLQDYSLLTAAGVDVNTVISKMGPNLNEYVQTAIAAGQSIPENMKPIIDAMLAQGALLDENGKAYASAEEAGITYTKTLTEGLMAAVEAINQLVAALTGVVVPPIHVPVVYDDPGYQGQDGSGQYGPEGYAAGSKGFEDFGPGRLAVLHGVERVQTPEQAATELSRQGMGGVDLLGELKGLRRDMTDLPQILKRSFRDAMMLRS